MTRRALVLLALVAVLLAASGAMAGDATGYYQKVITFEPGSVDTASYLDGAAAVVNDSLIFYSQKFGVTQEWTVCKARLFYQTQDTISIIDTIGYALESKFDSPYDSTWWTIGTVTKKDEDQINTLPLTMTSSFWFDADSVGIGNLFRVKFVLVATQAEWRASDNTGIIPFNAKYILYLTFWHKGNQ